MDTNKIKFSAKAATLTEKIEVELDTSITDVLDELSIDWIRWDDTKRLLRRMSKHEGGVVYVWELASENDVFIFLDETTLLEKLRAYYKEANQRKDLQTLDRGEWWDNDEMLRRLAKRMGYKVTKV